MNPFAVLGLSADADEAQIKRAYAKLLRANRPDDDPAGFQRLNEAYQHCLEWARRRAAAAAALALAADAAADEREDADEDEIEADGETAQRLRIPPAPRPPPVPVAPTDGPAAPQAPAAPAPFAPAAPRTPFVASAPPAPAPAQPPAPSAPAAASAPSAPPAPAAAKAPRAPEPAPLPAHVPAAAAPAREPAREAEFDAKRFLDELYRRAETDTVAELEHWLAKHPALYQLERKHALAPALIACLSARAPLYLPQLDAMLRFFDLDTVHERSAGLQARIVELRAQTRRRGVDLREIEFDPNPKPGKRGRHPIDLDASTVIFLLMGFAVLVRVVAALAGTDRP